METDTNLSPMPSAPNFPASPSSGARKRSIYEVDGPAVSSPNAKRTLTEYTGENQENCDPHHLLQTTDAAPAPDPPKPTVTTRSRVEVVVRNSPPKTSDTQPETPASKKRKAASATKDAKQEEKELRERQKAEEKAKKEEEKVKKEEEKRSKLEEKKKREAEREEEKRKKEAEREEEKRKKEAQREGERKQRDEKKRIKENEKAAKEEEKRQKDEEKEKKVRSQMKLNSFFAKPTPSPASTGLATTVPESPRKSSTAEVSQESSRGLQSDYERDFPPFFLQSHTIVAPPHRFERDAEALAHVRQTVDSSICKNPPDEILPFRPSEVFQIIPFRRRRGECTRSVKDILLQLQKSQEPSQPGQSLSNAEPSPGPQELLSKVTMKSLKFGEDIRPPYQGTYTRHISKSSARRVSRNPYHRGLPEINYDYDSEAEWEEPEDGEDLGSEEEDEGSDEGEDDLDGFLDDEDDALAEGKRRLIVGDLEPVTTGLQWAADGVSPETQVYQIETISDAVTFPIDPFSTAYWEKPKPLDQIVKPATGPADIFRVPALPGAPATSGALPQSKAKRPFPPDQLAEFKEAVEGNDLSKIGLVEILKKRFPKVSKETLKATLDQVAVRVGQKEADKKWVCR